MALALVAGVLAVDVLAPRAPSDSDYFGPNMPTWVRVPTTIGDPVYVGILMLNAQPGDTVVLRSLGIERTDGDAAVEPMVRILGSETQTLGGIPASDLDDAIDLSTYLPLANLRFSAADGPVEFAARITGTTPIHGFDGLWIRFTLNGEPTELVDRLPMRATVCTGSTRDEAVERCLPIEAEMESFGL